MADEASQAAKWIPDADEQAGPPECDRCGTVVSYRFYRVWAVDGELHGCRECLPRSVRFSNARTPDPPEDFDVDRFNRSESATD